MTSLHKARDRGDFDLEAWEEAIRNAVLCYGASLLEGLLAKAGCGRRDAPVLNADGQPMHSIGVRQKTITTLLGEVTLRRTVIGQRLKHSGMFWSLRGANAIIASRCCHSPGGLKIFGKTPLKNPPFCHAPAA